MPLKTPPSLPPPDSKKVQAIQHNLLAWYQKHRRALPWRRDRDPYAVWVSEMMLQQTRVTTVIPYFKRWMERFPNVHALARAREDDVLHAWQGLGYYSRARNLRRGAQLVVNDHGGALPANLDALRKLPGIGPYTAGAIASIAFGQDSPIVDGNVIRVLTRLFALSGNPARQPLQRNLWSLAQQLIPSGKAADFNQGLMELGATRCTPTSPICGDCPLLNECSAQAKGTQAQYPQLPSRVTPQRVATSAALVKTSRGVLLVQEAAEAPRWASLWVFPTAESRGDESVEATAERAVQQACGVTASAQQVVGQLEHAITRFRFNLSLVVCSLQGRLPRGGAGRWVRERDLSSLAMPSPHRKYVNRLIQGDISLND